MNAKDIICVFFDFELGDKTFEKRYSKVTTDSDGIETCSDEYIFSDDFYMPDVREYCSNHAEEIHDILFED
jgi:hypothetical protein